MTTMELSDDEIEILELVRQIDPSERPTVMNYLTEMAASPEKTSSDKLQMHSKLPPGEPGWKFMKDLRKMHFTPEDLAGMDAALEELGQVNLDEWDLSG